jgi:hypothetical protein
MEAKKIGGQQYTQREFTFVLLAGIFHSFNSGYVNGRSCLSGRLTENRVRRQSCQFQDCDT